MIMAKFTGLSEVKHMLDNAPRLIVAEGYLKAMTAATEVIETAVYEACPERDEGDRDETQGHLKDAVRHTVEIDSRFRGAHASIGFGQQGHKALWLEFGHQLLVNRGPNKGKFLKFIPPHPFVTQAFSASADQALQAFQDSLISTFRGLK